MTKKEREQRKAIKLLLKEKKKILEKLEDMAYRKIEEDKMAQWQNN